MVLVVLLAFCTSDPLPSPSDSLSSSKTVASLVEVLRGIQGEKSSKSVVEL